MIEPGDGLQVGEEQPAERGAEPSIEVPSFLMGGRVERTGIALVHEGEWVVPADGSEAVVTESGWPDAAGPAVTYEFPIRLELVGRLGEAQVQQVAGYVFDEFDEALRNRT